MSKKNEEKPRAKKDASAKALRAVKTGLLAGKREAQAKA
jgi:hypothetical protein